MPGVRLRVDETKLKEQGDSCIHLKESPKNAGTEAEKAEKVVSANETEQKNANADSPVPASESAR